MKTIFLIRHAESVANSGERNPDPNQAELSSFGHQQAEQLAETLRTMDIPAIYYSRFPRTQLTAAPFLKIRSHMTKQVLPIHEFTHREPATVKHTTEQERRKLWEEYWGRNDPEATDGPNSESFIALTARIRRFTMILKSLPNRSAVFGHGRFFTLWGVQMEYPEADFLNGIQKEPDIKARQTSNSLAKELMQLSANRLLVEKKNFANAQIVPFEVSEETITCSAPNFGAVTLP